jgi:hypothetical protein
MSSPLLSLKMVIGHSSVLSPLGAKNLTQISTILSGCKQNMVSTLGLTTLLPLPAATRVPVVLAGSYYLPANG